jgi:hypothetical protein
MKTSLNLLKIYSISIWLCLVFAVTLTLNYAFAQLIDKSTSAQSSDNFLTYIDKGNNFTIQYPADWQVKENNLIYEEAVVDFEAPDKSSFTIMVKDVPQYLDTNTMTRKTPTLEEYAQNELSIASQMGQPDVNIVYKQIRSNEFPVSGSPGWKIEYMWGYIMQMYWSKVFTIANDKVYILQYSGLPLKVPDTLPMANHMVETFQIG